MKDISVIFPIRGNYEGMMRTILSFDLMAKKREKVEILIGVDSDDTEIIPIREKISQLHPSVRFMVFNERSEHFTKHYWNALAREARGRWIIIAGCDNVVLTKDWDTIINNDMAHRARIVGDDMIHGLTRDNIKRHGEDALYPHFSCNPVLSAEHVKVTGGFFDERYWCWGSDQAVSWLYKMLENITHQKRIVSLVGVKIFALNSMHTTDETDEVKLEAMRQADKGYQKFLRISQEHPCSLTQEDYLKEAEKLKEYINDIHGNNRVS